jgi:hypothetical protein
MKKKNKEIVRKKMNELVYTRVKKTELTSLIKNKLIGLNISKVGWAEVKPSDLLDDEDYRIDVSLLCDDEYIDFTIWYLKTRYKQIFIVEISVD